MTRREQLLQVLAQDIDQDCAEYELLLSAQQQLYQQLLRRDSAQIELTNAQITEYLKGLSARSVRRNKVLAAFSLAPGSDSMQRLFGQFGAQENARLQATWQRLGALVAQCQAQNQHNGQLLAMHNDILNQLLAASDAEPLYQPRHY